MSVFVFVIHLTTLIVTWLYCVECFYECEYRIGSDVEGSRSGQICGTVTIFAWMDGGKPQGTLKPQSGELIFLPRFEWGSAQI